MPHILFVKSGKSILYEAFGFGNCWLNFRHISFVRKSFCISLVSRLIMRVIISTSILISTFAQNWEITVTMSFKKRNYF